MLLVHPIQEAGRFLPAILLVVVTGRSGGRSGWWDLGFLALVVLYGMSKWVTTSYRIADGQIEVRTGLVNRRRRATAIDRVRAVDVTASPWHRLLGLAKVEIGTGAAGQAGDPLALDALSSLEAHRLRAELLHGAPSTGADGHHRAPGAASAAPTDPANEPRAELAADADVGEAPVAAPEAAPDAQADGIPAPEQVLLRLDPSWVRYAPLTTSGLVGAAAVWGLVAQSSEDLGRQVESVLGVLTRLGGGIAAVAVVIAALVVVAVAGYLLSYWGFQVSRHPGGSLQIRRGLLTTRATSIDETRLRGLEVGQPLGLRWARAARLTAITTGVRGGDAERAGNVLAPPAPAARIAELAEAVLADPLALTGPLHRHGPAARRRRWSRALLAGASIGAAVLVARIWWQPPLVVSLAGFLPLALAPWLAIDRYAALGHLLTDRHLVTRSGTFERRREVLARRGVIGVVIRQSFFQRRAGLVTLVATTAAGRQAYRVYDVPTAVGEQLATQVLAAAREFLVDGPRSPAPTRDQPHDRAKVDDLCCGQRNFVE